MNSKRFLAVLAVAALVTGFTTTLIAGGPPSGLGNRPQQEVEDQTAELQAKEDAALKLRQDLEQIARDREGAIADLVSLWEPTATGLGYVDGWEADFVAALERASDMQLLALKDAVSYDHVRAILQGRDEPVTVGTTTDMRTLGDLTADLVYTPVVPCRFFDTRFDVFGGPGGGNPGTVLNYYVHGTNALLAPQGHTAGTGCPSPSGEPSAIAANFTVVPYGKGHIRAWPYLAAQPNASFLNYNSTVNSNLANAGIISTCFLCGPEISVSTWFGSSDSLADVMGYFYPAIIPANSIGMLELDSADMNSGFQTVSQVLTSGFNYLMSTAFTASASGKCVVSASGQVNQDTTDTYTGTYFRTARQIGAGSPANDNNFGLYTVAIPGGNWSASTSAHAVWDVSGGTSYRFGCFFAAGGDFVGDTAYCRINWLCH